MKKYTNIKELISFLRGEKIKTWFDLGLFIDRMKEEKEQQDIEDPGSYTNFLKDLGEGGLAFLTFHYMVDGVTVEIGKYASLFERSIPGVSVHYVTGKFRNKSETLINPHYKQLSLPEISGFGEWDLYEDFFLTELERGSDEYNALIKKFWDQTLRIIDKLGTYILEEKINLLYVVNICSNPGNVSASLALVLLSELLGIPVINNNHDFYFEGGHSKFDRKSKKIGHGPRDFFYTNAHLGEVFSIIEMLYPWESKTWLNVNINLSQTEHLIKIKGHNPANVMEIGTAVDTSMYTKIDKRRSINSFLQFEKMLARYNSQLVSYSIEDVEERGLVSEKNPKPILIGYRTRSVQKFISENIIFLQPTRIISRKRIEVGFSLLLKMFQNENLLKRFKNTPNLKFTLLISGPIAIGHFSYFENLLASFGKMMEEIPEVFRDRVFLALLLGELDRETFQKRFENPIGIPELYNISSLILLPSKTEGRGLPIIEATACGTPIFCRRYEPEEVYSEVIGEKLDESNRLRVYEIRGKKISDRIVEKLIDRVFFPHNYAEDTKHNKEVVEKRYSLDALNDNIVDIIQRVYDQLHQGNRSQKITKKALTEYKRTVTYTDENFKVLVNTENRQYLPGYGTLSFMLMLKSLIDPSYFRMEQQRIRGMVYFFAREIIKNDTESAYIPENKKLEFYNAVDSIFKIRSGDQKIRHDHSMSYRHRNRYLYLYQEYTFQEITGLVNYLYLKIVQPFPLVKVDLSTQFFIDWNLALSQLTGSNYLAIDNRTKLIEKLKENIPIAYFPGEHIMYELEFFALQAIRARLKLPIEEEVSREVLEEKAKEIAPVYIFAQENKLGKQLNKEELENYISTGMSDELRLLREFRLLKIVKTEQLCVGIHFAQLGEEALRLLRKIRDLGGFLLTNRRHAALMTDIVNIDRFHVGRIRAEMASNIMGLPLNSGYIQYVPAGLRTTLAYPTPIQTAKDFNDAFHSDLFLGLEKEFGEKKVMEFLVRDAELHGSPVMHSLETMKNVNIEDKHVNYEYVSGVYADGFPYSGALARINFRKKEWDFIAISTNDKPKTVSVFVNDFKEETGNDAEIAWNGGYILNPELVGKLGLPESYIGSPLGLLITNGECQCPPLFKKAALLIDNDGNVDIKKVHCADGIRIGIGDWKLDLDSSNYNRINPGDCAAYYDLLYKGKKIVGDGRVVLRFSGKNIKEVIRTKAGEDVKVIPTGICLSLPKLMVPRGIQAGMNVDIEVRGMEHIRHAIEAGPYLLEGGEMVIDMEDEGWKTENSIMTQAARLDYLDMRGPKIAVGINDEGELMVLTINGRIRESVGATHIDMADILKKHGMRKAMGFDPGGSSTLVVGGKTLNISPYNHLYEYNVYAMSPEPRAVSNAVIGYIRKK